MELFSIIALITGVFLICFAFIMTTKDFKSCLIFQIIPFFLGLAQLFVGAKGYNWI